jgi:hypothetical protein
LLKNVSPLASANDVDPESNHSANISVDPFAPRLQDETTLSDFQEGEEASSINSSKDSANISIGNSEINLSVLASERDCEEVRNLESRFPSSLLRSCLYLGFT